MGSQFVCFVEGSSDEHVVKNLLGANGLSGWDVLNKENKTKLLASLATSRKGSEIRAVAVILDADASSDGTWAGVCGCLKTAGYEGLPHVPSPEGTIIVNPNEPTVGVWIMPDNERAGMLEDFLATPH